MKFRRSISAALAAFTIAGSFQAYRPLTSQADKNASAEYTSVTEGDIVYRRYSGYAEVFSGASAKGIVTVEPQISGLPVTIIGEGAFADSAVTEVKLPESVSEIKKDAFKGCPELEEIVISNEKCVIYDSGDTICNAPSSESIKSRYSGIIRCKRGSTAARYALKYNYIYRTAPAEPITTSTTTIAATSTTTTTAKSTSTTTKTTTTTAKATSTTSKPTSTTAKVTSTTSKPTSTTTKATSTTSKPTTTTTKATSTTSKQTSTTTKATSTTSKPTTTTTKVTSTTTKPTTTTTKVTSTTSKTTSTTAKVTSTTTKPTTTTTKVTSTTSKTTTTTAKLTSTTSKPTTTTAKATSTTSKPTTTTAKATSTTSKPTSTTAKVTSTTSKPTTTTTKATSTTTRTAEQGKPVFRLSRTQVCYDDARGKQQQVTVSVDGADKLYCNTLLYVYFDKRIKIGEAIRGEAIESLSCGQAVGDTKDFIVLTTGGSSDSGKNGHMWTIDITLPDDCKVSDVFEFEIGKSKYGEIQPIFTNYAQNEKGRAMTDYIFSSGLDRGSITVTDNEGFYLGDVNNDKLIDSVDASLILMNYAAMSSGKDSTFTDNRQKTAADVNGDDTVDSVDASVLLAFYANLSGSNPITDLREFLK